MKRLMRIFSVLLAALLIGWYFSPQVYRVLHLPDTVDTETDLFAPALAAKVSEARLVRESGDERIVEVSDRTARIVLFGILPLKTVTVAAHTRSVNAGGEAVGVILKTEGVQIVGFEKIETANGAVCPAASAGLAEGDMIISLDSRQVTDSIRFRAFVPKQVKRAR